MPYTLSAHPISYTPPGRTPHQSPKANHTASAAAQLRTNRRNSAKQAQLKKRQSLVSATRIFSGTDGAPRVVAIVPLTEDVKARDVSAKLAQAIDGTLEEDEVSGLQKLRCVPSSPIHACSMRALYQRSAR